MALKDKYSWGQFLKENPEFKEKKIKRTSEEGQKAYEAAKKKALSGFLKQRSEKLAKQTEKVEKQQSELVAKLTEFKKAKNWPKAKITQAKVSKKHVWLKRLGKQAEKTKAQMAAK